MDVNNEGFSWSNAVHDVEQLRNPPQRTWVELTDEEIEHIIVSVPFADEEDYEVVIRAAVAKLKEKNT